MSELHLESAEISKFVTERSCNPEILVTGGG
jgi:hypothetical protein